MMVFRLAGERRKRPERDTELSHGRKGRFLMAASRGMIVLGLLSAGSAAAAATVVQEIVVTANENEETVLFSAERISRLDETSPVRAEGNVRAFFGDQSLMADEVTYNQLTDIVTAHGNVVIYDAEGQIYFADAVELTGDLRDGIATNFGALIAEKNRLVGSSVVRSSSGVNTIEDGSYTACKVCRENGTNKVPTWEVSAIRVSQDTEDQMIRFRHATIKAFGIPVLYTPYFEFPDPTVERKSGFLAPSIGNSSRAGFEIELPYYWSISEYQDATFSPRYTSELGTLWKGEYRVNTHDSSFVVQAGAIDPEGVVRNNLGQIVISSEQSTGQLSSYENNRFGSVGPRWHLFAKGEREFTDGWRASFDIDYVSDKNYLRTYDIQPEDTLQEAIDILQPDRLENELRFTQETENTFTDITTVMFQSLRGADDNDFNAHALPRIRHERLYKVPHIGGDLTFSGNFLALNREEGLDSMRAIAKGTYEKVHTTKQGHRLRGFAEIRGDAYRYRDSNLGIQACRNDQNVPGTFSVSSNYELCRTALPRDGVDEGYTVTRFLPTIGGEWSFPLAKFTPNASYLIEPRVQFVASPEEDFTDDIYNEDSAFFEFDTITLFDWNKSTGFDQWEDGQRMNVGIAASANYTNGLNLSGTFGQQYRIEKSLQFEEETGLGDTSSDFVGELNAGYGKVLSMSNRFRIDDNDGTLRSLETTLRGRAGPFSTGIRYVRTETLELENPGLRDENLTLSAYYKFSERWTAGGIWREDLDEGVTTTQQWSIQYSDDCTIFSLDYRRDNRLSDGLEDNESLTFNVDVISF